MLGATALIVLLLIAFQARNFFLPPSLEEAATSNESFLIRLSYWPLVFRHVLENPLGMGLGTVGGAHLFESKAETDSYGNLQYDPNTLFDASGGFSAENILSVTDNNYLKFSIQGGFLLLAAFLALVISVLMLAAKLLRTVGDTWLRDVVIWATASFVSLLTIFMFVDFMESVPATSVYWLAAGVLCFVRKLYAESKGKNAIHAAGTLLATLAVTILITRTAARAMRGQAGRDAGPVERLGRIDVAEAENARLIEQDELDLLRASPERRLQPGRREGLVEGLGRELRERPHAFEIGRGHDHHQAEMALVVEQELLSRGEPERGMRVGRLLGVPVEKEKPAGHAQMREQRPAVREMDQDVLAAPADVENRRRTEPSLELPRRGVRAEPRSIEARIGDLLSGDQLMESSRDDLDFGKFGHRRQGMALRCVSKSAVTSRSAGSH